MKGYLIIQLISAKKFSQDLDDKKDAFVNEFIGNMISK